MVIIISVIIPCYNAEDTISNCLKSVIDQSYSKIEIIVIDDGSTDNTKNIVEKMKDSRIKYFYQTNKGVSAARNYGLKVAKGEYISFVDSDDCIHTDMLLMMHRYLNQDQYDMVVCGIHGKTRTYYFGQDEYFIIPNKLIISNFLNNEIGGYLCNKLFKISIIRKFSIQLDESIHFMEDLLFCNMYTTHSDKDAIFLNKDLYIYNQTGSSITLSDFNYKKMTGVTALDKILSILNKNDSAFNLYYTQYYHFLLSIYVNGAFEKKINKNQIKEVKKIILNCETDRLTSKRVFWSVKLSKFNLDLYYFIWKVIKKGFRNDK